MRSVRGTLSGNAAPGTAKNGYPYIGYYVNVQVMGFFNRYVAKNASYVEVHGVPPGRRGKMRKLQAKANWYNRVKTTWAVHVAVQVKPGTRVSSYGMVGVFGRNGYVADMPYSCIRQVIDNQ